MLVYGFFLNNFPVGFCQCCWCYILVLGREEGGGRREEGGGRREEGGGRREEGGGGGRRERDFKNTIMILAQPRQVDSHWKTGPKKQLKCLQK